MWLMIILKATKNHPLSKKHIFRKSTGGNPTSLFRVKYSAKIKGKHLRWSLLFHKNYCRPATLFENTHYTKHLRTTVSEMGTMYF